MTGMNRPFYGQCTVATLLSDWQTSGLTSSNQQVDDCYSKSWVPTRRDARHPSLTSPDCTKRKPNVEGNCTLQTVVCCWCLCTRPGEVKPQKVIQCDTDIQTQTVPALTLLAVANLSNTARHSCGWLSDGSAEYKWSELPSEVSQVVVEVTYRFLTSNTNWKRFRRYNFCLANVCWDEIKRGIEGHHRANWPFVIKIP